MRPLRTYDSNDGYDPDHLITFQCTDIDIRAQLNKNAKKVFKKTNFDILSDLLGKVKTCDIFECSDPDKAYSILESRILPAIEQSTKLITPKDKQNKQWFDHELIKLRIKRQRIHNILKKEKNPTNQNKYNLVDKAYGKLIIQKKKEFNQARLDKYKYDLKRKWGVINDILGRKKKNGTFHSIYVEGVLTSDKSKIADGFNKFFSEIPKAFHDKLPKMENVNRIEKCTSFLNFNSNPNFKSALKSHSYSMFIIPTCPEEIKKS